MATGDLKNNLRKLKTELRRINFKENVAWDQINIGLTEPLLPILHYLLADFSCAFSSFLSAKGYEFYGKSDLRFIEVVYKILLNEFHLKPMLTKQQFFSVGFVEIKVIFLTKIISLCHNKNAELTSKLGKRKKLRKTIIASNEIKKTSTTRTDEKELPIHSLPQVPLRAAYAEVVIDNEDDNSSDDEVIENNFDVLDVTDFGDPTDEHEYASRPYELHGVSVEENKLDFYSTIQDSFNITEDSDSSSQGKDILDVTEIEESNCEVLNSDKQKEMPNFRITKHVQNHQHVVKACDEPITAQFVNPSREIENQSSTTENCKQCSSKAKEFTDVTNRLSELEKKFSEMMLINSELSAKVILMETRIKFLEVAPGEIGNEEYGQQMKILESQEVIEKVGEKKSYSPLRYSDDEIIMKGFKPVTMRDVIKAQKTSLNQGKENTKPLVKTNVFKSAFQEGSSFINTFDQKTMDTIRNVQKQLKDAENLLLHEAMEPKL